MLVDILTCVFAGLAISLAATVCPPKQFWNGTSCQTCSGCPLGSGVKTSCTEKEDTECQSCWLGFDFSNTTGMETCMSCSEYSNCLEGNAKIVKNCTLVSPHVCQGCADGNFFDKWAGENGGCIECSPPCGFKEIESRECTTAHDRQCVKQWKTNKVVVLSTISNVKTTTAEKSPIASTSTEQSPPEPEPKQGQTSKKELFIKSSWYWVLISVTIPVMLAVSVLACKKRRKNRLRTTKNLAVNGLEQAVDQPLLPLHGLDTLIRDLSIEDRRFITQRLNGKYYDGYFHWQIVAGKLGLKEANQDCERAENPAEKLLTAYGERNGSTIRNFIRAVKEAELTLLAGQLEEKFNKTDEHEKSEEHEKTSTWV